MAVNLSKVHARLNNIKKKIYYEKNIEPLRLYNVNTLLLELDKGWHMPTHIVSNLAISAEYLDLYIADTTDSLDLTNILKSATVAEVDGEKYRILQYARPRGATKKWYIRLESTGEYS